MSNFMFFVYIIKGIRLNSNLKSKSNIKYYIGFTNDPIKRIKQHNRELPGGAKKTNGYHWTFCGLITNFDCTSRTPGLQIEWRLQHSTRNKTISKKILSFIEYINIYKKPSPNSAFLTNKLFMYLDHNMLFMSKHIDNSKFAFVFDVQLTDVIINHIVDPKNRTHC